jgi:hypothetical protein
MGKWTPCKRKDFIRKLKKLGFGSPEPGGKHFYMRYESFTCGKKSSVADLICRPRFTHPIKIKSLLEL